MCFPPLASPNPTGRGNTRHAHIRDISLIMSLATWVGKTGSPSGWRTFVWCLALAFSPPCGSRSVFKKVCACISTLRNCRRKHKKRNIEMYNAKEKSTGVVAYLAYVRILWIASDKIRRSIVRFYLEYFSSIAVIISRRR